jgi:hypothetical protein
LYEFSLEGAELFFLIDYSQNNSRQMNMLKESFPAEKLFAFINKPEPKTT